MVGLAVLFGVRKVLPIGYEISDAHDATAFITDVTGMNVVPSALRMYPSCGLDLYSDVQNCSALIPVGIVNTLVVEPSTSVSVSVVGAAIVFVLLHRRGAYVHVQRHACGVFRFEHHFETVDPAYDVAFRRNTGGYCACY
jgi:hypothetical protein